MHLRQGADMLVDNTVVMNVSLLKSLGIYECQYYGAIIAQCLRFVEFGDIVSVKGAVSTPINIMCRRTCTANYS